MFYKLRSSISLKVSLLFAALVTSLLIGLGFYFSQRLYSEIEDKFGWTLEHIAITGALQIDGDQHARIKGSGDETTSEFIVIRNTLRKISDHNDLGKDTIYTFRRKTNGTFYFAVMPHPIPFVGDEYIPPGATHNLLEQAWQGQSGFSSVYHDIHGEWISGYAPIRNNKGKVTGVLAVDFRMDRFLNEVYMTIGKVAFMGFIFLLPGIVLSYALGRHIARPLIRLDLAAEQLAQGDYGIQIQHNSPDEVGNLTRSFNLMASSLRERFQLLKYVSPHTKQMITRLLGGSFSEKGERRQVAVLFSDIRGYTRYSSQHTPEEVIGTLNHMLGIQAEIIKNHRGYVDKFVGDEVVAIFEGEDRNQNALLCARAIVESMEKEQISNSDGSFLNVGIGIATGDVVMGSIGSEDRKDFTVIGDNVNLAARLCNAARPGQVLVSSDAYLAMQKKTESDKYVQTELSLLGKAHIKGFAQEMHIYRLNRK